MFHRLYIICRIFTERYIFLRKNFHVYMREDLKSRKRYFFIFKTKFSSLLIEAGVFFLKIDKKRRRHFLSSPLFLFVVFPYYLICIFNLCNPVWRVLNDLDRIFYICICFWSVLFQAGITQYVIPVRFGKIF